MDIEKKLKELLKSVINVDIDSFPEEARKFPLLSARFNVYPHQMMGLFLKVEQAFKIEVPDSAIDAGTFNSFDGILSVVREALNEK